VVKNSRPF